MKLNCDIGEGFGAYKMCNDELIMPLIDLASIACGFHASDSVLMDKTVKLAKSFRVSIGAHPSYPDLLGFGRRSMKCSNKEIETMVIYQISALFGFCKANEVQLEFVKPHGALYNDMIADDEVFKSVLGGISKFDKDLKLMLLSTCKNEQKEKIASEYGIGLIFEVFADRNYTDEGFLVSRSKKNAVIKDKDEVLRRLKKLKDDNVILSVNGKALHLKADCICVHGDNEEALALVKSIRESL